MPGKSIFNAIDIKPEGGVASKVRLLDATGAYAVELVAPAGMTGPVSMSLPATTGAANEVLTADGLGGQYWSPGVPGPTGPTGPAGATGATGATGPAGVGGKVLQVVSGSTSTVVTVSTTTYTDTTLTATITPMSVTSKILVIISQNVFMNRNTNTMGYGIRLLRDSTVVYVPNTDASGNPYEAYYFVNTAGQMQFGYNHHLTYMDAPASTSPLVYKTQTRPYLTANSAYMATQASGAINNAVSTMILMEIEP